MSPWNYRVVQSFDKTEYFIAEVYYDGDATQGWVDSGHDFLCWEDYDDLRGTVELLKRAVDKPLLRVVENDRVVESLQPDVSGRYRASALKGCICR